MKVRTRRWEIRPNGGRYGHFWRGDLKYLAHNEGGYGPLVFNLKLWRGWLPVGFYVAIGARGHWVRLHRGFS